VTLVDIIPANYTAVGVDQCRCFAFTVGFHFLGTSQEIKEAGQLQKRTDQVLAVTGNNR
jgi:hypothetical protein